MRIDRTDTEERLARIEQMIAEFREAKRRHFLRRAIKLWRRAEANHRLLELDAPPERVH